MKSLKKSLLSFICIFSVIICVACNEISMLAQGDIEKRLKEVIPDAEIKEISLIEDSENVTAYYQGFMENSTARYDFKLDAYTAETVGWIRTSYVDEPLGDSDKEETVSSTTAPDLQYIGEYQAKSIIANYIPDFMGLKSLSLNYDEKIPTYSGVLFTSAGIYFEFEIDAITGEILSSQKIS